jgi:hypothetical protein
MEDLDFGGSLIGGFKVGGQIGRWRWSWCGHVSRSLSGDVCLSSLEGVASPAGAEVNQPILFVAELRGELAQK